MENFSISTNNIITVESCQGKYGGTLDFIYERISYVQAIQGILVYRKQVYFKLPSSPVQCWSCVAWGPLALVDAPGRDGTGEEAPRKPKVGRRVQLTDPCSRQSRKGASSMGGGGGKMHQLEKKRKRKVYSGHRWVPQSGQVSLWS